MKILPIILVCIIGTAAYAENDYPTSLGKDSFNYGVCSDIDDPYEKLNRKIFMFNSIVDHFLLRPIAKGYNNMFSDQTRGRVGNALKNTQVPLTMVNNTLQLDGKNTLLSFWQFMINSTLGIGGIDNVARKRGLHVEPQTLGSTLASYGVGPGPYIILPFFAGTGARDIFDAPIANGIMNPLNYALRRDAKVTISGARLVHDRAEILPFTDNVAKTSPDPYITMRSANYQYIEKQARYPSYYRCHHD